MKVFFGLSLITAILVSACGSEVNLKHVSKKIDYVQVAKFNIQTGDKIGSVTVKDPKEIKSLLGHIGSSEAPWMKCGHDFELHCFKKDGTSFLIEVNSDELCRTAVFNYEDETQSRYFSEDGVEWLNTLF
ncbi:MAG: hypothetical protein KDC92_13255 [Bacteroidetes bacterium]|nr:hypothetical protein [Bacteroidota bacterium]